ncbi:MAG TPA: sugar-binding domain-containing protein [Gemmataceae bacterium]|jgi:DNA-binding transcriptional regulator LsrR (DeoR family)
MSRSKGRTRDVTLEAQAAAYLYSQGNDQAKIGAVVGVSQGEVSRLLALARREGWIQTRCVLPESAVGAVEQLVFTGRNELRDKLRREAERHGAAPVRDIRVLHSGGESEDAGDWDVRLLRFGRLAAARLQELVPRMGLVGVTWGKTIARVVDGLRLLNPHAPPSPRPLRFIPLTGEPLTYPDPETSSSTLAHRLGEIFNPGLHALHSLAAVPAFIPAKFPRKSQATIRDFIAEIAGYRTIFERADADGRPQEPLVDRLDTIITGVGTVSPGVSGRLLDDRVVAEGVTKEQLQERAVGDIGGVFLPRHARDRVVNGINERWTGVRLEHILRCATAAAHDHSRAGVVVLAIGAAKAQITLASIRAGLITELILDHDLARALLAL